MPKLAVIGGTGLDAIPGLEITAEYRVKTPFGTPSAALTEGRLPGGGLICFMPRHGASHGIAPHKINYRANIWALRDHGVTDVLSVAAVGGIAAEHPPPALVVPDQIIDYTYGRANTFFDGEDGPLKHIDFTWPYSAVLRERVLRAGAEVGVAVHDGGVYGATQGPRLESSAEIDRMERDGCTLVGMTGMPEAALAREAELDYAHCAVVVNEAAGRGPAQITMDAIRAHLEQGMQAVMTLVSALVQADDQSR